MRHRKFCGGGRHQCPAARRSPATICVDGLTCAGEHRQLNGSFLRRPKAVKGSATPFGYAIFIVARYHESQSQERRFQKAWFPDKTKDRTNRVLSLPRIPVQFRLQPGSDEEELDPSYPLNSLAIASNLRGRI